MIRLVGFQTKCTRVVVIIGLGFSVGSVILFKVLRSFLRKQPSGKNCSCGIVEDEVDKVIDDHLSEIQLLPLPEIDLENEDFNELNTVKCDKAPVILKNKSILFTNNNSNNNNNINDNNNNINDNNNNNNNNTISTYSNSSLELCCTIASTSQLSRSHEGISFDLNEEDFHVETLCKACFIRQMHHPINASTFPFECSHQPSPVHNNHFLHSTLVEDSITNNDDDIAIGDVDDADDLKTYNSNVVCDEFNLNTNLISGFNTSRDDSFLNYSNHSISRTLDDSSSPLLASDLTILNIIVDGSEDLACESMEATFQMEAIEKDLMKVKLETNEMVEFLEKFKSKVYGEDVDKSSTRARNILNRRMERDGPIDNANMVNDRYASKPKRMLPKTPLSSTNTTNTDITSITPMTIYGVEPSTTSSTYADSTFTSSSEDELILKTKFKFNHIPTVDAADDDDDVEADADTDDVVMYDEWDYDDLRNSDDVMLIWSMKHNADHSVGKMKKNNVDDVSMPTNNISIISNCEESGSKEPVVNEDVKNDDGDDNDVDADDNDDELISKLNTTNVHVDNLCSNLV